METVGQWDSVTVLQAGRCYSVTVLQAGRLLSALRDIPIRPESVTNRRLISQVITAARDVSVVKRGVSTIENADREICVFEVIRINKFAGRVFNRTGEKEKKKKTRLAQSPWNRNKRVVFLAMSSFFLSLSLSVSPPLPPSLSLSLGVSHLDIWLVLHHRCDMNTGHPSKKNTICTEVLARGGGGTHTHTHTPPFRPAVRRWKRVTKQ